jgi:hypothetical protein
MSWAPDLLEEERRVQTMGNERVSDIDFLQHLADHPRVLGISTAAPDRLRKIIADMHKQEQRVTALLGSPDEDAAFLEKLSREPTEDIRIRQDLLRIASRLKSLPEPPCQYCNGHGLFFPNKGFELREEKEVWVRICDCKAGEGWTVKEIQKNVADALESNRCTPA